MMAHAGNTRKAYASHVKAYVGFCIFFDFNPLPASDIALSQFLVFQSQTVNPSSLQTYMSGIRAFHLDHGFTWPHVSTRPVIFRTLQGLKRVCGAPAKPKLAITLEHLLKFREFLNFDDPNDVMWWGAALTAFFCALRKDNVTVEKASSWNSRANLTRGDFAPKYGWARVLEGPLWVRLRHSKTNQQGAKCHLIPLIPIRGSPLCPVSAVVRALGLQANLPANSAPFCQFSGGGESTPLTHGSFVRRFKVLVSSIGLDPNDYSGHSFRIGAATLSFSLTSKHELIKAHGDWASDAYLAYNRMSVQTRCLLPSLLALHAAKVACAFRA